MSFSLPSFATNSVRNLPEITKSEKEETPATESLSCATLFVSNYNAWISLGHTPEDAYARATRVYNTCMGLDPGTGN